MKNDDIKNLVAEDGTPIYFQLVGEADPRELIAVENIEFNGANFIANSFYKPISKFINPSIFDHAPEQ